MNQAGLLTKQEGSWTPTPEGITLGIALYEGETQGKTYTSPIYSRQAQDALGKMVRAGQLEL